jgi:hypothetical protein
VKKIHIVLQHGNAFPHAVHLTSRKVEKFGCEVLPHPLLTSGVHPFRLLPDHDLKRSYEETKPWKLWGCGAIHAHTVAKY